MFCFFRGIPRFHFDREALNHLVELLSDECESLRRNLDRESNPEASEVRDALAQVRFLMHFVDFTDEHTIKMDSTLER